jgi:DNA-binding transcriptional LysR family regulator
MVTAMRAINWESRIGRRLRLRDLHIFFAVLQFGSMAKAAANLGMSQPAVSETIADLEHTLGVRLLDRGRRGVTPTIFADTLLQRGKAAFDELRQGIKEIEVLSDPAAGEVRIGCSESVSASLLPKVLEQFRRQYPHVALQVDQISTPSVSPALNLPDLRERRLDLVLARITTPLVDRGPHDDLAVEVLFDDPMVLAVGSQHPLARRRSIDLAELAKEPWILPPPDSLNYTTVADAFRERGVSMPKVMLISYSVHLRNSLLTRDRFVTVYPNSNVRLYGKQYSLKVLPVQLPVRPWLVAVITLKNRTLNPAVQRFLQHIRIFAKFITAGTEAT